MGRRRNRLSRREALRTGIAGAAVLAFDRYAIATGPDGQTETESTDQVSAPDNSKAMQAFIEGMPKAELHMHIEGSTEPEMAIEIAARNRISLPYRSAAELKSALSFNSLESFLRAFSETQSVLLTSEDFYDITYAYLSKVHSQNVVYAEMKFDPQAHTRRGVAFETVLEGLHTAQLEAERNLGIKSQLIMCFQRDASIESANDELDNAMSHREKIVAIGLDNSEIPMFPMKFADIYRRAREANFKLTSHCDVDIPNSVQHIRGCIEQLKVDRLDHGTNVLESEELVELFLERQICLTACPTSGWNDADPLENGYLQRVAYGVEKMLARGLRVTLNTDDPGLMGGRYMNEIMIGTQQLLGLGKSDLAQLMRNAFSSIWVSDRDRASYLQALDTYLASESD